MTIKPNSYLGKMLLAIAIVNEFEKEFEKFHLSRNLVKTIQINTVGEDIEVEIPAEVYNIDFWKKYGVIIYEESGDSYASEIDQTGGFSHRHIGYVDKCINNAVSKWIKQLDMDRECKVTNGEEKNVL